MAVVRNIFTKLIIFVQLQKYNFFSICFFLVYCEVFTNNYIFPAVVIKIQNGMFSYLYNLQGLPCTTGRYQYSRMRDNKSTLTQANYT